MGELGKTFLWDPYFPVGMRDTLFHVLLMLSKHRLQAVPVVELSNSHVIGFITQVLIVCSKKPFDCFCWLEIRYRYANYMFRQLVQGLRGLRKQKIDHKIQATEASLFHMIYETKTTLEFK